MLVTLVLISITFVASCVGTISGFGISTIMLPLASLIMPFPQALLFTSILHLIHNIGKTAFFYKGINYHIIVWFGIPGMIASFIGARFVVAAYHDTVSFLPILGCILFIYGLYVLIDPNFRIVPTHKSLIIGGFTSGLMAGCFGIHGAIKGAFLSAFSINKATYLATVAALGIVMDSVRVGVYVHGGIASWTAMLPAMSLCIIASIGGIKLGQQLVNRIPEDNFRYLVALCLCIVGLRFLLF